MKCHFCNAAVKLNAAWIQLWNGSVRVCAKCAREHNCKRPVPTAAPPTRTTATRNATRATRGTWFHPTYDPLGDYWFE